MGTHKLFNSGFLTLAFNLWGTVYGQDQTYLEFHAKFSTEVFDLIKQVLFIEGITFHERNRRIIIGSKTGLEKIYALLNENYLTDFKREIFGRLERALAERCFLDVGKE